jgi:hypothetical protein
MILRIRDSGIGIPAESLPRIFDMFYQGDRGLERTRAGLGVGLTLVRRRIEAKVPAPVRGVNSSSIYPPPPRPRLPVKMPP